MYTATTTIKFLNTTGAAIKPEIAHEYVDITKQEIFELERHLTDVLQAMNADGLNMLNSGPIMPSTNPLLLTFDFEVLKDGKRWTYTHIEWPNMGDEQQAFALGLFNGKMANQSKTLSGKGHAKAKAKGHGKP